MRRRIADITEAYIQDAAKVLNKFLPEEQQVQFVFTKGDIKSGIVDVHVGKPNESYSWAKLAALPVMFRVIALSTPMNRIKSLFLDNAKYIFFDEFICNLRGGEKYLQADENFLVQEIYTTYNRESKTPIRVIAAGNPYSVYTPLFMAHRVDTSKLTPGSFVVGDDYVIDCFKVGPELKAAILKNNPMYQFDDAYARYAFGGEAINDMNIRIHKTEPKGFKLKYVFKLGRDYLSIHKGNGKDAKGQFKYWICSHDHTWLRKVSKTRDIVVFNFGDMIDGSVMMDRNTRLETLGLKDAINNRQVTFNCINAEYMTEDIYSALL